MNESSPGASALLNSANPGPNHANTAPLESLGTRDRIVELLKAGVATGQIAEACGVSDGYVSQVKSDPGVAIQIAEARAGDIKESLEHDEILNRAEMKALRAIDRQIEMVPFSQKLAAFRVLNAAERRSAPGGVNHGAGTNVAVTVTLALPATMLPHFVTNERNEVIEVEGKQMSTVSPKSLDQILEEKVGVAVPSLPANKAVARAAEILEAIPAVKFAKPKIHRLPSVLTPDVL